MIPLYQALLAEKIPSVLCSTGQHAQLLEEMFDLFGVKPDYDLKIMKPGQDLFHITETVLQRSREVFEKIKPRLVVVQGDTSSAMAAGLAAFYLKIPVAHVEAGLRTGNIYAPFPEEMNRRMITRLTTIHFAPTSLAVAKLKEEGVDSRSVHCTGNTVIDALYQIRDRIREKKIHPTVKTSQLIEGLKAKKQKIILLTAHRRESFEGEMIHIFNAIKTALQEHPELTVIYPMHPNPAIKKIFDQVQFDQMNNIIVMDPVPYQDMVYLLDMVDGVATDSGGIQEEAVSLKRPTLVLRNETDRPEGLKDGLGKLVGTNEANILAGIREILDSPVHQFDNYISPYGDGKACERTVVIIKQFLNTSAKETRQ
jgi:UDP-N-acetylglucosamine 2-epimerase (non-hydrolysing)